MAETTNIEWCDATFNPWIGCTRVSPACDHCYAAVSTPARTRGIEWGPGKSRQRTAPLNWKQVERWNGEAFFQCTSCAWRGAAGQLDESAIRCPRCVQPTLKQARRRVFCASLADWLDNEVPTEWFVDLLDLIRRTPKLDWLLLTKRIGNWQKRIEEAIDYAGFACMHDLWDWLQLWRAGTAPANVWIGATVVNQDEADRDVPRLLQVPARVRFLSIEPMLGSIDLKKDLGGTLWIGGQRGCGGTHHGVGTPECPRERHHHHDNRCSKGLDWIIAGGESGPKARPMHPGWIRSLRDQCAAAGVPFVFKQWGEWAETEYYFDSDLQRRVLLDGTTYTTERLEEFDSTAVVRRVGKRSAGNALDGRQHLEWPA